ncbi:hypothetical protein FisN_9Lh123 [Fistulifera solaris]|uniref:Uncharacterized protein n=1 Tax=Fistulifera solaris TaxID=1519565 RepID=A0A1Z5KKP6_FISSO|nr:hypothetical protein FisN_9Lh123 [Fistulifera solaris]|eukprot:GAX26846.1 hypothetical protein FisN_9Lh123 [Fistulifera solaris]
MTTSKNIIHQLHQQSTYGRIVIDARTIPWTAPSWLPLPAGKVIDLAFDVTGVLLAVATVLPQGRSAIRVYDWDMLEAADLQYRRRCEGETAILSPVIDLALSSIAFLKWNPFQPDVLAVGIRNTGTVRLYDMGIVAEWGDRRGHIPFVELKTNLVAPTDFSVCFVTGTQMILAANQFLSCWDIHSNRAIRKWTCDLRRRVTSLVAFNDQGRMAVGTINGMIAILDCNRLSKQPFSRELTPTVLKEFNTLREIDSSPSPQYMGIRGLSVDRLGPPGWLQLRWVTSCGWHLSAQFDGNRLKMEPTCIHYTTARMQCENARGVLLPELPNAWSMPGHPKVCVGQLPQALFWENVPAVTQILPGHDSRAEGDDVCRYVRSDYKRFLLWRKHDDPKVRRIPLSKSKGSPVCFAIHPGLEWIVVATEQDQLYLINSRAKMTV